MGGAKNLGEVSQDRAASYQGKPGRGTPCFAEVPSFLRRIGRLGHARVLQYLVVISVIQLVNGLGVLPAIRYLFGLALRASHLENVTDRTITVLLSQPISVVLLLAIAVVALAAISLQFVALIVMVNRQQSGRAPNLADMFADTAASMKKLLRYPSPILMVYFFLALPLGGLGLSSVLIQGVGIPPFVTREYLKVPLSSGIYILMIGGILWLNLRLILTLPLLVIGDKKPLAALGSSLRATRKNFFKYLVLLALPLGVAALAASLLVEFLVVASDFASTLVTEEQSAIIASVCIALGHILGFMIIGAATVVALQILVALVRDQLGITSPLEVPAKRHRTNRSRTVRVAAYAAALALVTPASFYAAPALGQTASGAEDTQIFAHRGYSAGGVENTISALDAAAAHHADYVEADFQQTKDGHFVASHDTNLLMVSGVNKKIYEMTLEEVRKVTVREGGFTDSIPTMSEYLEHAHDLGIPVLVELKVTGHESKGYLTKFLADLDATGTTTENIYHSLDPKAVKEIKHRRPELRVGLTVAMSAGQLPVTTADFYTLEQASFRPELLDQAHEQGKEVYVWTVNDESTIRELLSLPVDGIVTDSVEMAIADRQMVATTPNSQYRVGYSLAYLDLFR